MMLMISVKSACQLGWFSQRETQELLDFVESMWNGFSSPENVMASVNSPISPVMQVIERFYPFVKLGHILVSFEAKPQSNILVKDFLISEKMPHSPKQLVGLFVIRTEDMSKSSCIIHPQEVSFLLNGKSVKKRVNISMDSGPQLPTNVTALLNVGANLLQTIGCFGGSYFIVIAFMEVIQLPENPLLKDYVHSEVIESNSDCDIIEGPSRISLSCPISRTRIKLPVKGHVCKHLQCFDFWNYVNINMRIPSWRCPHCNQSVCYTDIRVDQNMIKILEGVGHNDAAVVISADGSWTVVTETDENVELMWETTHDHGDPNRILNVGTTVLDLTRDENEMESSGGTQVHEQKPLSEIQGPLNNTHKPTTLNQSSASTNALSQLPRTLNAFNGQQFMNLPQIVNTRDSAARQALPMAFLQTSSPQDRIVTNTSTIHSSMHSALSPQFQGSQVVSSRFHGSHSHVPSLGHCQERTSDLLERWNHVYGSGINQAQLPLIPLPQHHYNATQNQRLSLSRQSSMPSSITHPLNSAVNYRPNPDGAIREFTSQELMNLTSPNTVNWRQQTRMRGSIAPGSTVYDHMIIQPTRPVQTQTQTLPPPSQPTACDNIADEIQAFLAHPSYPTGFNETQTGKGLLPVNESVGLTGSFWSMPPETW